MPSIRHPRTLIGNDNHRYWFITAVSSAIGLGAVASQYQPFHRQASPTQWAVIGLCMILILAVLAVSAHIWAVDKFSDTKLEGLVSVLVVSLFAAILPVIQNPDHDLAVGDTGILNANLYLSGWCGFFASFVIFVSCFQFQLGPLQQENEHRSSLKLDSWASLCATSLVVMVTASRLLNDLNCGNASGDWANRCTRTKYAVSIGVLSTVLSFVWVFTARCCSDQVRTRLHQILVGFMIVFWTAGIVVLTFGGDKAPASGLGNLYFGTWGSFCLAGALGIDCYKEATEPSAELDANSREVVDYNEDDEIKPDATHEDDEFTDI